VAVAEGGRRSEVREYGRIAHTPAALQRLAGKLGREGAELRFCYVACEKTPAFPVQVLRRAALIDPLGW